MSTKKMLIFLLYINISLCLSLYNYCTTFTSYKRCIQSLEAKCYWDQDQNECKETSQFLLGCNLNLNRNSCLIQIGDAQLNIAKCRFVTKCEKIPDPRNEKCENNLNKSGCLSITNPEKVCYWKQNRCVELEEQNYKQIQSNFDETLYSQSACSYIENYLVIHHLALWKLLDYTPNLLLQADMQFLYNYEIQADYEKVYDDPQIVFLQNNIQQPDGRFVWYSKKGSKSITLRNLKISDRYREGCIALEIENDTDFEILFRLKNEVTGINHVYCEYLNRIKNEQPYYILLKGICVPFNQSNLNDETIIQEFDLNCKSLNTNQCIYFDSLFIKCSIFGDQFEYPCQPYTNDIQFNCAENYCTIEQCKLLEKYYTDKESSLCTNKCLSKVSQNECQRERCIYLGDPSYEYQIICSPLEGCDQPGISLYTCKYLKAKCDWNETLQRCYTLSDDEISYFKCNEAINLFVCTLLPLSDQLCFWSIKNQECLNILDQPVLLPFPSFRDIIDIYYDSEYTISNFNLCTYNDKIFTTFDEQRRVCNFTIMKSSTNNDNINRYSCLNEQTKFCLWNQLYQICECYQQEYFEDKLCNTLENVMEKICQFAQVTSQENVCLFNQENYSCKEQLHSQLNSFDCENIGLSEKYCIKKDYCQYQANICKKMELQDINWQGCQSFLHVNYQICKFHNKQNQLCEWDENTQSCYSPSLFIEIRYKYSLNRFACEQVYDLSVFYNIQENNCQVLDETNKQLLNSLPCAGIYLNQKACYLLFAQKEKCFWNNNKNSCQNEALEFENCKDFSKSGPRSCMSLRANFELVQMKKNFCSFIDNQCQQISDVISDCGESELMNIHRCNSLTGLTADLIPIVMCAFVNLQCINLIEDSYDSQLILKQISCEQANLASCNQVLTPGEFCLQIPNKNSKSETIFNQKCISIHNYKIHCAQINTIYQKLLINQNFCIQAIDSCYYDQIQGCIPPNKIDLDCSSPGLSAMSCSNNTKNHRCAFFDNQCQYLSENNQLVDCTALNEFLCNNYKYAQCMWLQNRCLIDDESKNINQYTCSRDQSNILQIYFDNDCSIIEKQELYNYACDQEGLNYYTCMSLRNHYCIFLQNKCQFYRKIMCEDSQSDCKINATEDQLCVLKEGKCFHLPPQLQYECDQFEEVNYEFCYQFPQCAYNGKQCVPIGSASIRNYDDISDYYFSCVFLNMSYDTQYRLDFQDCYDYDLIKLKACPQFAGYYSYTACTNFFKCNYGFTKTGFGFCYEGNIMNVTCEQIPELFCTEDMSHLNSKLNCYFDGSCKLLEKQNYNCQFLSQFQSSYSACLLAKEKSECFYSHIDHRCKPTRQFIESSCQGSSIISCSLIENTCYYDGTNCIETGSVSQLNKYGCVQQEGFWQFQNYTCFQLQNDTVLQSCYSVSKMTCLSQMTKELHCRWINNECQQILQEEAKFIDSCADLNKRACYSIRLSKVQCFWNDELSSCEKIEIQSEDCSFRSQSTIVSLSLCNGQKEKPCIRNENGSSCEIISVSVNECEKYGLNEISCIYNTLGACQWKTFDLGGFCDQANLFTAECNWKLNKIACLKILTRGQYCFWNEDESKCENKEITNCESASYLNDQQACFSVSQELCYYNQITKECKKMTQQPKDCQSTYNKVACVDENLCSWEKNQCANLNPYKCEQMKTKNTCLNSKFLCEWQIDSCQTYLQYDKYTFCMNLPQNLSNRVCKRNFFGYCEYDYIRDQCYPQELWINLQELNQYSEDEEMFYLDEALSVQDEKYISQIKNLKCNQFKFQNDCLTARLQNQPCIWNETCQEVIDFNLINCTYRLNIHGCLRITKKDQNCIWQGKCFDWNEGNRQTNVNINVCKNFSVNRVYKNYSCVLTKIDLINCNDLGISKNTCLSITKQQCYWNDLTESCDQFVYQNQQSCSDYKFVSSYVCQMQETDECIFDHKIKICVVAKKNDITLGISKLACLSNDDFSVYWNGEQCKQSDQITDCNDQRKVNFLSCTNRTTQPCKYDSRSQMCTSQFNIQSLTCSTQGLNYLSCILVVTEPCIFLNGRCQVFKDYFLPCNSLKNVNAKTCSMIQNEQCHYNAIEASCQQPKMIHQTCDIQGINKYFCESNNTCKWNQDYQTCACKNNQIKEICFPKNQSDCVLMSQCLFENQICRLKQCSDLQKDQCLNQYYAGFSCYLTQNNECQSALICEDIINPKHLCQTIYINSYSCVQGNNQCFSYDNYEKICTLSNCLHSQCIYDAGSCREKVCYDYQPYECNQIDGCYLKTNGFCADLVSCHQITEEELGDKAIEICNQVSKDRINCNWQQISIYDESSKVCTNQYCSLFGKSLELCQGNEINSVSCILTNQLICQSCENLREECLCNQYENICIFSEGKCNSIICQSFQTQQQCQQASSRCYWSRRINNGQCLINCNKITSIEQCDERQNECYYDHDESICKQGEKIEADLSVQIKIEEFYSQILQIVILVFSLID